MTTHSAILQRIDEPRRAEPAERNRWAVAEVEAAGFRFEARSPLLAHAADDHTLKVVESGIRGKTDQFVLRFRKPRR